MIPNMIGFVNRLLRLKTMLRTFQKPLVYSMLGNNLQLFHSNLSVEQSKLLPPAAVNDPKHCCPRPKGISLALTVCELK